MVNHHDAACVGRILADNVIQQYGLATAGSADDGNHITLVDGEIDTAQYLVFFEGLVQVVDRNFYRLWHGFRMIP